jgi:hypothetical protein
MSLCPFCTQWHYFITRLAHDTQQTFLFFLTLQTIKFHSVNPVIALRFVQSMWSGIYKCSNPYYFLVFVRSATLQVQHRFHTRFRQCSLHSFDPITLVKLNTEWFEYNWNTFHCSSCVTDREWNNAKRDRFRPISETPDSNLGREIHYPGWEYTWFSSELPGEYRDIILK